MKAKLFIYVTIVVGLLLISSCKKEDTVDQPPPDTGSVFIDTVLIHTGPYVDTTDSKVVIKNTKSSGYDLLNHRISVGYKYQAITGGLIWSTSQVIPSGGSLTIYPSDVGMLFFSESVSNPFFVRLFDGLDVQLQEYIAG